MSEVLERRVISSHSQKLCAMSGVVAFARPNASPSKAFWRAELHIKMSAPRENKCASGNFFVRHTQMCEVLESD